MIRIVLMWPTPFGSKLLSYILENLRIEYCLFIGVPGFEDDRLDYIPWHHAYGAEYEHYISWENLPPLDEEIISQMASCESSTFRLMDYEFEFQSDSAYGC
ncbi:MAG: hypothetical protein NZL92_11820, partial [Gloeomargarita sp. SKYG116]|nr:hypothetical protein [Gloeomargarita sp. SKYG116]MDW8402369.1 hypothetical protein [Gloeomargarita sp. SKYGB_i_bin116]